MIQIANNTNQDFSDYTNLIQHFYQHAKSQLKFPKDCSLDLVSDPENSKNPLGRTAFYEPESMKIVIYIDNRHFKDILRSFSHELVHHSQNCRGDLENISSEDGYAQKDPHLRNMEKEAYLWGNMNLRDWEDNYKQANSLMNEWIVDVAKQKNVIFG